MIGGESGGTGVSQYFYGAKIVNGGITYLDVIPAKIGTTYGIYDKVSGVFANGLSDSNLKFSGE